MLDHALPKKPNALTSSIAIASTVANDSPSNRRSIFPTTCPLLIGA